MLVKCGECQSEISDVAPACPQCGCPQSKVNPASMPRKQRSKLMPFVCVGGAVLLISAIQHLPLKSANSTPLQNASPAPAAPPSNSKANQRATLAGIAVASLRQSLRNPESLKVESALVDDGAKHACITYRAQNGFGGTNFSHVVFTSAGGDQSPGAWNRHCANRELNDEKYAALALAKVIGQE